MDTERFEYRLPKELIAQHPISPRDSSRLLVLERKEETVKEDTFRNLIDYLSRDDILVLNDTRVIPARLSARRIGGGRSEVFLLKDLGRGRWNALVRPGAKLSAGTEVVVGKNIPVKILERTVDGGRIVEFPSSRMGELALRKFGQVPLPPYIKEPVSDPERYQTIYAKKEGSTASPTAALHFTPELLKQIEDKGITIVYVTLHMGSGSFQPIREESLEKHRMPVEDYEVSESAAGKIDKAREEGRRVVACGTDVVRVLETAVKENGRLEPGSATTNLFIIPGYKFKVVDVLITNLHLSRSSHLVLVSAFAGRNFILKAYQYASKKGFRFYTFGDATIVI